MFQGFIKLQLCITVVHTAGYCYIFAPPLLYQAVFTFHNSNKITSIHSCPYFLLGIQSLCEHYLQNHDFFISQCQQLYHPKT